MPPKSAETVRRVWRASARSSGFLERSVSLQQPSSRATWDAVADGIAKRYAKHLPEDIRSAREIEAVVHAWRLDLEMAFVQGADTYGLLDPALDTEAVRTYITRLGRIIPNLFGGARTWEEGTAKRRRMGLMRFVQLCVDAELSRWPRRSSDNGMLQILKSLPPGLTRASPATLDKLVATWKDTKAGAKLAGGRSKWRILSKVLTDAWGDMTPPTQLKKEWVEGRASIAPTDSNRYSLLVPNARDAFQTQDVPHDARPRGRRSPVDSERRNDPVRAASARRSEAVETTAPRKHPALPSQARLR